MFRLPNLPYGYGDLAPVISETTLRTHHGKHHARYIQVTNDLLAESNAPSRSLEEVIVKAEQSGSNRLFNNAAQSWNHGFYWESMRAGHSLPGKDLANAIRLTFGGLADLRDAFIAEGAAHFGSGWVWLIMRGDRLKVCATHDASVPITVPGVTPLLVCDVWEHAYYLDHKNDRASYLDLWWDQVANWEFAERQYAAARGGSMAWRYPAEAMA